MNHKNLMFVAVLFLVFCFMFPQFVPDDAYISFRYAQNLAAGNGLTFNPGERVEGYSNFLWILMCSVMFFSGLGLAGCVGLSILFGLGTLYLVWRLNRDSVLYLAVCVPFVAYSVSGMETALFSFLLVSAIWLWREGRYWIVGIVGVLLAMCRPEGLLVVPVLVLSELWRKRTRENNGKNNDV